MPYRILAPREACHDLQTIRATHPRTLLAFDLETTGLDPRNDKIRLANYLPFTFDQPPHKARLVDLWAGTPEEGLDLLRLIAHFRLVGHNLQFDIAFLLARGVWPEQRNYCTQNLAKLVLAGERGPSFGIWKATSLEKCAKWFCRVTLNKSEQTSEWGRPHLTAEQWAYAAADVEILPRLLVELQDRIVRDRSEGAARIEVACLPTVAWMAAMGMPFDDALWATPFRVAMSNLEEQYLQIRQYLTDAHITRILRTGTGPHRDPRGAGQARLGSFAYDAGADQILNSPAMLLVFLKRLGYPHASTGDDFLAAWSHPLAHHLRQYRQNAQIRKNFGPGWGRVQSVKQIARNTPPAVRGNRVYPFIYQYGCETGRFSYSYPNLQQVPNPSKHPLGQQFRGAFRAPAGRELVIADLSQIELRLAAQISGDPVMRAVYEAGGDIHTETARAILGVQTPTKEDRQTAKSANFGLLYGAGADTFRRYAHTEYGVDLGPRAAELREAFLRRYPGIAAWHRDTGYKINRAGKAGLTTRTLIGRPRKQVSSYTQALNTPVQGSGADVVKLALALLYSARHEAPCQPATFYSELGWWPCAVIHDEIILECPQGSGEAMASWLRRQLIAACAAIMPDVPGDAEAHVSTAWTK